MPRKLTQKEFEFKVKNIYGSTIQIVSVYEGNNKIIKYYCKICNNTIETKAVNMLYSKTCKICSRRNKGKNNSIGHAEYCVRILRRLLARQSFHI